MENACDVNQLDADVLLPPRKRLLAGLKKQSSESDATASPSPVAASCVTDVASPSSASFSSEFEARLKHLLNCHSNNPNLTPEEVAEASRKAAVTATKAAEAARAAAEEKAAIAAKAVAKAKSALDLVASFSEDAIVNKERNLKKNKSKKHVPVQLLYKKNKPIENCRKDEELARKLHRAMNSSPRISKNSPKSDSKGSRSKRPRSSSSFEITEGSECGMAVGQDCLSLNNNGQAVVGKIDSEGSNQEVCSSKKDKKNVMKFDRSSQMEIDNGEAESSHSKPKNCEDSHSPSIIGKKRGRTKLKKLPLSICTSKDKAQPREEIKVRRSSSLTELNKDNQHVHTIPVFPVESSTDRMTPIEATSTWKCQDFKVPACIKQNKAVQS